MPQTTALAAIVSTAVAVAASWACGGPGTFACDEDAQCVRGSNEGRCEASGFCSFPDPECPSMQRYGERAPAGFAGHCTLPSTGDTSSGDADADDDAPDPDGGASTATSMPIDPGTTSGPLYGTTTDASATNGSSSAGDDIGSATETSTESGTTGPPPPPPCVPSFVDDFEDGVIDPAWGSWDSPTCSFEEADGRIAFTVGTSTPGEFVSAGLYTAEAFPMQGAHVRAEVTPFSAPLNDAGVWLTLIDPTGCELQISLQDGEVYGQAGGDWFAGVAATSDEPIWLQLRIDAESVGYWEWSDDGTSWNLAHSEPSPCDASMMSSAIFAGDDVELTSPITRSFESYERCDPAP